MGIADRGYIQQRGAGSMFQPKPGSANTWLIVATSIVFVLQQTLVVNLPGGGRDLLLNIYGAFNSAQGFLGLEVWRFVSFQFLHANLVHIFFNMFGLYMFGRIVEEHLGGKRYIAFYLTCGIFGAVLYLILNLLGHLALQTFGFQGIPGVLYHDPRTPLIGASAGVFGVLMACAYLEPRSTVILLFPPIPLRISWLAYGYVAIAVFNLLMGGQNAGGDAAHVGGAIAGYYFIRRPYHLRDFFEVIQNSNKPPRGGGVNEAEINRILGKVREFGPGALTQKEREALHRATEEFRARERYPA